MDDVRRNCLFSSVDVVDLLLLLFDRPIRLKKPLLNNFLAVDDDVDNDDDDDRCGIGGLIIVLSEDVLTNRLFNGIGLSTDEDDCRFNKSRKKNTQSLIEKRGHSYLYLNCSCYSILFFARRCCCRH